MQVLVQLCPYPSTMYAPAACSKPQISMQLSEHHMQQAQNCLIDCQLVAVQATVELDLVWLDDGRLLAATNNASAASNCTHPCSAGLLAEHSCCDHVWRPTLRMDNALKLVSCLQIPISPVTSNMTTDRICSAALIIFAMCSLSCNCTYAVFAGTLSTLPMSGPTC